MGFNQFLGNEATVRKLRLGIASGRLPQAIILSGPAGSGKYALALMLAQTLTCLENPVTDGLPDFCGRCSHCTRIALSSSLSERVNEAITAREEMREVDRSETRILIQTHPDVLIVPPDPPQLLIKIGQVRSVLARIHRTPAESTRSTYIFTSCAFMKEAANSLLKILEEPPAYAHIFLLAENPAELLPTIRSRAGLFRLHPLPPHQIEDILAAQRKDWRPADRSLVTRLAEGAVGQALGFDLAAYRASRRDALTLLKAAMGEKDTGIETDYSTLFRTTETYRGGAEGQEKTLALIHAAAALLEDLLLLHAGASSHLRNVDLTTELTRMAQTIDVSWIERASRGLTQLEQGMRRNLLRSLALDSFALGVG